MAGPVMEGKYGRDAIDKAEQGRGKQHFCVEYDADGGYTAFSGPGKGDDVEEIGREAKGKFGDHFGDTVGAGAPQDPEPPMEAAETKRTAAEGKVPETGECSDGVGDAGSDSCTADAPFPDGQEQPVKARVAETAEK